MISINFRNDMDHKQGPTLQVRFMASFWRLNEICTKPSFTKPHKSLCLRLLNPSKFSGVHGREKKPAF